MDGSIGWEAYHKKVSNKQFSEWGLMGAKKLWDEINKDPKKKSMV